MPDPVVLPPDQVPVEELLPHRPPLLFVRRLLEWRRHHAAAEAVIDPSWLWPDAQTVPRPLLIEAIAQTVAAAVGYESLVDRLPREEGLLVSCRKFSFHRDVPARTALRVEIYEERTIRPFGMGQGKVMIGGDLVAEGDLQFVSLNPEGRPVDRQEIAESGPPSPPQAGPIDLSPLDIHSLARAGAVALGVNVGKGDRVLIALPNGALFLAALLGTWEQGAEALLVDSGSGPDIRKATDFLRPKIAVLEGEPMEAEILSGIDRKEPGLAHVPSGPLMLFTSGSTGEPRGVLTSCERLMPEALFLQTLLGLGPGVRAASLVPWSHAYGFIVGLLAPLSSGCDLILSQVSTPREMLEVMGADRSDVVLSTPAQLGPLARLALSAGQGRFARIVSSGASLPETVGDLWRRDLKTEVIEIYGSTETGGVAYRKEKGAFIPFPHVAWRIATDPDHDGELEVRSLVVSDQAVGPGGRWFALKDPDGWYRTGDSARIDGQGFALLGRTDRIVKIGGKRISLDEIERAILATGLVEDAAVWAGKRRSRPDLELRAAVTPLSANLAELEDRLRSDLPSFKRPRRIAALESFPGSREGKKSIERIAEAAEDADKDRRKK